jgi:four helix bundle protein
MATRIDCARTLWLPVLQGWLAKFQFMPEPNLEQPESQSGDPLQRMRAYRLACELVRESWADAEKLTRHRTMEKVSAQLYAAVGSIAANLGEGYAHSSGKDRARIFEYALGSTRESIVWFRSAEPVLGADVVATRIEKLDEIRRLLMAAIPRERDRLIRPAKR